MSADGTLLSRSRCRRILLRRFCLGVFSILLGHALSAQEISNGLVTVRAVKSDQGISGFNVTAEGRTAVESRFSSPRLQMRAARGEIDAAANTLHFTQFSVRDDAGFRLGGQDGITIRLKPGDPYPLVSFDLSIAAFDPEKWKAALGPEPFHFLNLYLADADTWHQRGWLNATPRADRFPLLLDPHTGTPEISAYPYNRNWSYTPPLGAHPLPVIGLWAPSSGRYVGLEFQTTRLEDNSEKDIATGYRWVENSDVTHPDTGQFVALVYPYGGPGYQQMVLPAPGARLKSHGTLLWSLHLPATDDPNRFLWSFLWERCRAGLPSVPSVPDLAWIPGGIHLTDFPGSPNGQLIGGVEKPFQVPGSRLINGWGWQNESPTASPARRGDANRLRALESEARELMPLAKRFQVEGDECVFWEKPLVGEWTPEWGGPPATTLHNANGFAAGRLFLGLFRDLDRKEYLPVVEGVFNWAKHIAWTRNEFADVPSSPFAIGGTLSASFCLDYYRTFKASADAQQRDRARLALELARTFTYRYLVMWPSDNNREDNLDSSFLWEPNSGRDWTGAACANEVFWNLDTLAQTAVHTGDPVLMWALQGSLDRWHLLYQNTWRDRLADYQPGDMTEGYGLYPGNVYGVGARAGYGFAANLVMTEPIGNSTVRVLAGEKAALAFRKGPAPVEITDYRYADSGNLAFTVRAATAKFDLSLTVPYVDISEKPVAIIRDGKRRELRPGDDSLRPPQALWSLYLKNVEPNDRVEIGQITESAPLLPTSPPLSSPPIPNPTLNPNLNLTLNPNPNLTLNPNPNPTPPSPFAAGGYTILALPYDSAPDLDWNDLSASVGVPRGRLWAYGVPFDLAPQSARCAVTNVVRFAQPIRDTAFIYLLYSAGDGRLPSLLYANAQQGSVGSPVEALAWRAWPPIYSARLLVGRIPVSKGGQVAGLDPGGRAVWAVTAQEMSEVKSEDEVEVDGQRTKVHLVTRLSEEVKEAQQRALAAFDQGAAEWKRISAQDAVILSLREAAAAVPSGKIAILPPAPGGEAFAFAHRTGLLKRSVTLSPNQLVDPAFFNAHRFPVALYLAGEDYVHTVRTPGDGAAALERYVQAGGTLILLASRPFPLFYATGPGSPRAEGLTGKLGLPLVMSIENLPVEKLTVRLASHQTLLKLQSTEFPYRPVDPRLRSIERRQIPPGAKYTPLATVIGQSGKDYGDAAGLVELPGGGRILYIASILQQDPEHGFAFLDGAFRYLLEAAKRP
jgi:hypothetical protein